MGTKKFAGNPSLLGGMTKYGRLPVMLANKCEALVNNDTIIDVSSDAATGWLAAVMSATMTGAWGERRTEMAARMHAEKHTVMLTGRSPACYVPAHVHAHSPAHHCSRPSCPTVCQSAPLCPPCRTRRAATPPTWDRVLAAPFECMPGSHMLAPHRLPDQVVIRSLQLPHWSDAPFLVFQEWRSYDMILSFGFPPPSEDSCTCVLSHLLDIPMMYVRDIVLVENSPMDVPQVGDP